MNAIATPPESPELALLLDMIDRAYDRRSWHGPNLRGSLRGLSASQAAWRPAPERKAIAEIALHAAYWKYVVRRRLLGLRRGSFARKGSNWFPIPQPLSDTAWREILSLIDTEHRALRAAIAGLDPASLHRVPRGSEFSQAALVEGAAAHDLYHAGQIQLLKRYQGGG